MSGLRDELIPDPRVLQTEGSQISDHILSTSCGIVERPGHHCGDDLVIEITLKPGHFQSGLASLLLDQ